MIGAGRVPLDDGTRPVCLFDCDMRTQLPLDGVPLYFVGGMKHRRLMVTVIPMCPRDGRIPPDPWRPRCAPS
jgi:hypothetical protein